ncbi:hypothetical protein EG850_08375 [Gulosibacter macacae]|uniref:AIPR protein n=1 Tax=Gulosibacter macacae TaxID=2488791 RepID=A0A3P3VYY4_9MICO|nr:AIPR family protein [Gulosibacter macacae]RRJ86649.1 hypothetical protein EG850_08375 [Gulosibacter macacae]
MSETGIRELFSELGQKSRLEAADANLTTPDAMGTVLARYLEEFEVVTDLQYFHAHARGPHNKSLDIVAVGEDDADASLSIVIAKVMPEFDTSLTRTEINRITSGALDYVQLSLDGWLQGRLDESSTEYDLAAYFADRLSRENFEKIRVFVVTNGRLSSGVKSIPSGKLNEIPVSFQVWDLARLHKAISSPDGMEPVVIDLSGLPGGGVAFVEGGVADESGTTTYLFTLPGQTLASIYDEFGSRVLESNVRGFLSVRGAVNRGIQWTLETDPDLFLAFNNGLTTTATGVSIRRVGGKLVLRSLDGWQIVNGGQTTASMWYFLNRIKKRNPELAKNLDRVFIQVKLVVVSKQSALHLVPLIAKYANSQNKVSVSDLFSNSPFHQALDDVSKRVLAPAVDGSQYETHWFYERARGAYDNQRARLAGRKLRQFDLEHPKDQRFEKLDVARVANIWSGAPHIVSKGAQSSFVHFSKEVGTKYDNSTSDVNSEYFKQLVAQLIISRDARRVVLDAPWYSTGYLANIVAYGVSKLVHDVANTPGAGGLDFDRVWRDQKTPAELLAALDVACEAALRHLTDENRPQSNVTQWAKQEQSWKQFRDQRLTYPDSLNNVVVSAGTNKRRRKSAAKEQQVENELLDYVAATRLPVTRWRQLLQHDETAHVLTDTERGIVTLLANSNPINENQWVALSRGLTRLKKQGIWT